MRRTLIPRRLQRGVDFLEVYAEENNRRNGDGYFHG